MGTLWELFGMWWIYLYELLAQALALEADTRHPGGLLGNLVDSKFNSREVTGGWICMCVVLGWLLGVDGGSLLLKLMHCGTRTLGRIKGWSV